MSKRRRTRRSKSSSSSEVDFAAEYAYVVNDLKRFALLAIAMFATLIILALVIQ